MKRCADTAMPWDYGSDIDYDEIDKKKVRDNELLQTMLVIASFIEITSDTYAKNLTQFYSDNQAAVHWLTCQWDPEEVQHGEALRRYIERVWPEFEWEKAYKRFLQLYLPLCTLDEFQPTKGREMLARMIVETGTSTLYRSLHDYALSLDEPVLADLAHRIYKDEVCHYGYFDRYFEYYNQTEKLGRKEILKVINNRLKEASSEDIELAFQAWYETTHGGRFDPKAYDQFVAAVRELAGKYYPYKMAIKMMLHPLHLHKAVETPLVPVVRGALKILGI